MMKLKWTMNGVTFNRSNYRPVMTQESPAGVYFIPAGLLVCLWACVARLRAILLQYVSRPLLLPLP